MNTRVFLVIFLFTAHFTVGGFRAAAHPGSGIVVDDKGQIFFTDTGEGIWKKDLSGALSLFSESAVHWMAYDKAGHFGDGPKNFGHFERITPQGSKPVLILCSDFPFTFSEDGNLYYADTRERTRIVRRTPGGTETVLAGTASRSPVFHSVTGMAAGPDGSIYAVDIDEESGAHAVLKIAKNGEVSTFSSGFLNDLPNEQAARRNYCRGLFVHPNGATYVAATDRRALVRIAPAVKTSVVLQATAPWSPHGVTMFGQDLYVLEYSDMPPGWDPQDRKGWVPRVRKVDLRGNATIVATVPRQAAILGTR